MSCGHGITVPGNLPCPSSQFSQPGIKKGQGNSHRRMEHLSDLGAGPQQGSPSPPSDATDVECPCPMLGDPDGDAGGCAGRHRLSAQERPEQT